jgi:hypothetical protein
MCHGISQWENTSVAYLVGGRFDKKMDKQEGKTRHGWSSGPTLIASQCIYIPTSKPAPDLQTHEMVLIYRLSTFPLPP